MFKKNIYLIFLIFFSLFCLTLPSKADEKINAEKINILIYDSIVEEGSFDNLIVDVFPSTKTSYIKSISASADDVLVDGVFVHSAMAKTLNTSINLIQKNNYIMPTKPVQISTSVVLTEDNINDSLQSLSSYLKDLKIKLNEGNCMYISFLNPSVQLKNGKLFATANLYIKGFPDFLQMPIEIETSINIIDKKVILNNLIISGINIQSLTEALKTQQIVLYDLRKTEKRKNIKINNSRIIIKDDNIEVKGSFTLPANSYKYGLKVSN